MMGAETGMSEIVVYCVNITVKGLNPGVTVDRVV